MMPNEQLQYEGVPSDGVLANLAAFFGRRILARYLKPGRQRDRWLRYQNAKVWLESNWMRRDGSVAKPGRQPVVNPTHTDAIYGLRGSLPQRPHVRSPELDAQYRKLMNTRKALRRMLRG